MIKDEALKMAIDFLDGSYEAHRIRKACQEALEQQEIGDVEIKEMLDDIEWYQQEQRKLIDRIKALEQPEGKEFFERGKEIAQWADKQQPAHGTFEAGFALGYEAHRVEQALEQPAQEPVAWMYNGNLHEFNPSDWATEPVTPLYTHPHQDGTSPSGARDKEFVTLTDDEIDAIKETIDYGCYPVSFARAIEQALKEKNFD